jgi:hypothetical protein
MLTTLAAKKLKLIPLMPTLLNVEKFIDDDIKEIHNIMSQTKINGVNIDVSLLNQALALKLEESLSELHSSEQNRKNEKNK